MRSYSEYQPVSDLCSLQQSPSTSESRVLTAPGVLRADEASQRSGSLQLMSNSQMKKAQDRELRANKVEHLIKRVEVDRDKKPGDWHNEYEAR